jgi:hypothetical protein
MISDNSNYNNNHNNDLNNKPTININNITTTTVLYSNYLNKYKTIWSIFIFNLIINSPLLEVVEINNSIKTNEQANNICFTIENAINIRKLLNLKPLSKIIINGFNKDYNKQANDLSTIIKDHNSDISIYFDSDNINIDDMLKNFKYI